MKMRMACRFLFQRVDWVRCEKQGLIYGLRNELSSHVEGDRCPSVSFISLTIIFLLLCSQVFASAAQIVFTEIHYHPVEEPVFNSDGTPALDLSGDVHEFVEIQNIGGFTGRSFWLAFIWRNQFYVSGQRLHCCRRVPSDR